MVVSHLSLQSLFSIPTSHLRIKLLQFTSSHILGYCHAAFYHSLNHNSADLLLKVTQPVYCILEASPDSSKFSVGMFLP